MYKNRHSGGNKNTRGWGGMGVSRGSLHFNAFCTHQHYSQNRKPVIIKCSCHIVPSDAVKALLAWAVWERYRMIPVRMQHLAKSLNTAALPPRVYATFTEPWHSPTQCVTVCVCERSVPWQCGHSGPFKSPWAAGESPKNDSSGQNEIK